MTKTVYVIRNGRLVEKTATRPQIEPLPFPTLYRETPEDREAFRRLYLQEWPPEPKNPLEQADKGFTPESLDNLKRHFQAEFDRRPYLRPRGE